MLNETEARQAVPLLFPYFWPYHIDPEDGGGGKEQVSKTLISTQF